MAKCSTCGKRGLFMPLIKGQCTECHQKAMIQAAVQRQAEETRRKEQEARQKELAERSIYEKLGVPYPDPSRLQLNDPFSTAWLLGCSAPNLYQNCPMVYRYVNIAVSCVNRDLLRRMVIAKTAEVTVSESYGGDIFLLCGTLFIAKLEAKQEMCRDWLKKGLPLICKFSSFKEGNERVSLFFYKKDEEKYKDYKCEVVKLTSCMSSAKQETIMFLEPGQKLFIELDDNDKPYIRDIEYNPIGNLPAKFKKLIDEDMICSVYFDHSDEIIPEDFEKDNKKVPYVRVYISNE